MTLTPVDTTNAIAVTDYLTKARDWLVTAVETSTPQGIGLAKVELAVAAEATKQLNLSKEIQDDATEMVRRAEFTLAKSIRAGQAEGTIAARENNLKVGEAPNASGGNSGLLSPTELVRSNRERDDMYAMAEHDSASFDEVLAEAKAEGNLSRANVARLAREKAGTKPSATQRRKPLTDSARDAGWELRKAIERLERIAADDRFGANKEQMAPHLRSHLENAVEVCQDLLARIDN